MTMESAKSNEQLRYYQSLNKRRNKAWYRLTRRILISGVVRIQQVGIKQFYQPSYHLEKGGQIRQTLPVGTESSGRISLDQAAILNKEELLPTIPRSKALNSSFMPQVLEPM